MLSEKYQVLHVLSENAFEKSAILLLWNKGDGASLSSAADSLTPERLAGLDEKELLSLLRSVYEREQGKCFSILNIHKTPLFQPSGMNFLSSLTDLKAITINDIYHRYVSRMTPMVSTDGDSSEAPDVHFNLITPCTMTHIQKYLDVPLCLVSETPAHFKSITIPFVESLPRERTAWIQKCLSGEAEADVKLFHDKDPQHGFIITPDSKWDGTTPHSLYLLTITMDPKIRCLRDLRSKHLPLLRRILDTIRTLVPAKYPFIKADQIRCFIHYFPSYFHFHVHVVHSAYQGLKGMIVGQAHLLEDVIQNLELDDEYYAKRTLNFFLSQTHDLFDKLSTSNLNGQVLQ